jgi:hypothetical protein
LACTFFSVTLFHASSFWIGLPGLGPNLGTEKFGLSELWWHWYPFAISSLPFEYRQPIRSKDLKAVNLKPLANRFLLQPKSSSVLPAIRVKTVSVPWRCGWQMRQEWFTGECLVNLLGETHVALQAHRDVGLDEVHNISRPQAISMGSLC